MLLQNSIVCLFVVNCSFSYPFKSSSETLCLIVVSKMQLLDMHVFVYAQLMSKSSEKPRLHQIPSEEMDSEDGDTTSPTEPTYLSRVRAESLREAESATSTCQEEQINLQHALILNQVWKTKKI